MTVEMKSFSNQTDFLPSEFARARVSLSAERAHQLIKLSMMRNIPSVGNSLSAVLAALSDPVRLEIVRELAKGERACGSFSVSVSQATVSHHLSVLREAGIVGTRVYGKQRINFLRVAEMKRDFPGLLNAILESRVPL